MLRRSFLSLPMAVAAARSLNAFAPTAKPHRAERNGWIVVRLAGSPAEIGFGHGATLAHEIADLLRVVKVMVTHDTGHDWNFFRQAAEHIVWPKVPEEYRAELNGIVEGAASRNVKFDIFDLVALNANQELDPYYTEWFDKQAKTKPEHCSAFVATGDWTHDHRPVIAHNCWTDYAVGPRWNIILDVRPAQGHRYLMDTVPGFIHSGDDFSINGAGLMITETTISGFHGFDPKGVAEFVRARKAMQYASSIDEFATLMKDGNNGGYANNWLVADRKNGEIASLELGLKHVTLQRTQNGYYVGSNFPVAPELIRDETTFDPNDLGTSATARRKRWETLMAEHKGKIDVELAKKFMADHYDTFAKKEAPSERTLCGHNEVSPRGMSGWQPPFGMAGAVQNKVADAKLCEQMSLWAAMGHACGTPFKAAEHIAKNKNFAWAKDVVIDLKPGEWTSFRAES